ncbi:MAG: selenocysteine-specific translation elongation factor [Nitrospirota bacterium]|mgnify:FL=1
MRYIILGTAGHIDHGKSSLVKALTGTDPDRLKEEKERGITIDLGFASLDLSNEIKIGIVDVPGHEGLIKNMLAGAGGIDIVMLVIAADEGVMPQTKEHLAICNLLNVKKGLVALTKKDLVEKDFLELQISEIKDFVKGTFLEGCPVIPVSSKSGEGMELLKQELERIAKDVKTKSPLGLFRLPIDRVFTIKGFGTVATGTLVSGRIKQDEAVEVYTKGIKTKIRGIQTHNQKTEEAFAGQRTALNLHGVEKEQIERGDVVSLPGYLQPAYMIDTELNLLKDANRPLKNRMRIRFYTGTAEAMGRVYLLDRDELKEGGNAVVQIRLESPVVCLSGDRFIIRQYSPMITIGGGEVLDPYALRHKKRETNTIVKGLEAFKKGDLEEKVLYFFKKEKSEKAAKDLEGWIDASAEDLKTAASALANKGAIIDMAQGLYVYKGVLEGINEKVLSELSSFHKKNPLKQGIEKEIVKGGIKNISDNLFNFVINNLQKTGKIAVDKQLLRLSEFKIQLASGQEALKEKIISIYIKANAQPPLREELSKELKIDDRQTKDVINLMVKGGELVRINDSMYFHKKIYDDIKAKVSKFFTDKKEMTVAEFRDIINTSRKYAVPLLEHFDSMKFTRRVGDKRILIAQIKD